MVWKRSLERWIKSLANCEVTPQAISSIAKSLTKWGEPQAPSAIHGPLGPIFYPIDKANIITDGLGNMLRAYGLCNCDNRRHMEAQVEALLATVIDDHPASSDPMTSQKKYSH